MTHLPRDGECVRLHVLGADLSWIMMRHVWGHVARVLRGQAGPAGTDGVLGQHPERVVSPRRQGDPLVGPVSRQLRLRRVPHLRVERRLVLYDELDDWRVVLVDQLPL